MQENKNGEIKIKNYNMVDLAKIPFDHKPTEDEAGKLQYLNQSVKTSVTPSSLAKAIEEGYSFHPGVSNRGVKRKKKSGEEYTVLTFREYVVSFQNVFAIDIDHHNFTLEDILSRCVVKPAIVYKTWSYKEEHRRWRVVFFGNKAVKDTDEIKRLNIVLTSPFVSDLTDDVLAYCDVVSVSPARLFYAGPEVVYVDDSARFNIEQLLANKKIVGQATKIWAKAEYEVKEHNTRVRRIAQFREYLTDKEWDKYQELVLLKNSELYFFCKKICEKLEKMGFDLTKTLNQQRKTINKKLPKPKRSAEERAINKDILEAVMYNLKDYLTDVPKDLDYATAIDMINKLPIHEIIGEDLNVHFKALTRIEDNASAMFFENEDGIIMYHDFGGENVTFSPMGLLAEMMAIEYGTMFYSSLEMILSSVDASLCSQYRKDAIIQIDFGKNYVLDILDGRINSDTAEVFSYGLGHLYIGCCNLLSRYIPNNSLLENRQGVVIYRALEDFHKDLLKGFYGDMSSARIKGYDTFVKKMNFLCFLGFFKKVHLNEMTLSTKMGIEEHKIKLIVEKGIDAEDYMTPNFYEFNPVTPDLLKEALRRYKLFFECGGRMKNISHKLLRSIDAELANETYHQTTGRLNTFENKFKDLCIKNARRRLNSQGYFTEDEIIERIMQTNEWYNGTTKKTKEQVLLDKPNKEGIRIPKPNKKLGMRRKRKTFKLIKPSLMKELNVKEITSNKESRDKYKVPDNIKSNFFVSKV